MARQQFGHNVTDEIRVTGWNRHRYPASVSPDEQPAAVALRFFRTTSSAGVRVSFDLDLSPDLAAQLGQALIEAAKEAVEAEPTDDSIVPPEVR